MTLAVAPPEISALLLLILIPIRPNRPRLNLIRLHLFRYYGEVLRPNLSNMQIATIALGVPIGEDGWVETVWHRYRQPTPRDRISGSRLDINPLGTSPRIGNELDIIASYRPKNGWDFELTGGAFRAGRAFGVEEGRKAWLVEVKVSKNF